jgi:hypothetical protein
MSMRSVVCDVRLSSEVLLGVGQPLGPAESHVADVAEVDQAAHALADRRVERGEIGGDLQVLDRFSERVRGGDAHTETVLKAGDGSGRLRVSGRCYV